MRKKKIQLEDILNEFPEKSYEEIYQEIMSRIERGILVPIEASKTNGRKPALRNRYWMIIEEKDYSEVLQELKYRINPSIDVSYFIKHPDKFEEYGDYIRLISSYLDERKASLAVPLTINERSFDIFHEEKFLDRNGGREFLSYLGMSNEKLNFYETSEPMSYYSHTKQTPQNLLIIENKDTFYSMRRHLIEGKQEILGLEIGTLIYGGGKRIYRTFEDYEKGVEPYFTDSNNTIYYFGDLDYEGILIYEKLCDTYPIHIALFVTCYEKMMEKALRIGIARLPVMKDGQNNHIGMRFIKQFSNEKQKLISEILQAGRYIPQEILNETDY